MLFFKNEVCINDFSYNDLLKRKKFGIKKLSVLIILITILFTYSINFF